MSSRTEAVITRKNRINAIKVRLAKLKKTQEMLKAEQTKLELECIQFMKKEKVVKLSDKVNNITIKTMDAPVVNDFMTFWKFIRSKNAPELITHGVNSKAWRERDMNVPGVGVFTRETLSITTRK